MTNVGLRTGRTAARRVAVQPLEAGAPRPSVTVVVPCHDYARFLPDSVGSALAQEDVSVDVVIVDDASTDDSASVARRLGRDPRVQVLQNRHNLGPVRTFNAGLAQATGTYLVRLDADDLLTPGSLARATALLQAWPAVGLAYGHPRHFVGAPPTRVRSAVRDWTIWPGRAWLERSCRRGVNVITSPEVVMRTEAVLQVGGQRAELAHTHDMEHWLRIASASDVGHVNGPDQALHREHARSLSVTAGAGPLRDLQERRDAFALLFRSAAVPDATHLHAIARRTLAVQALDLANRAYDRGRVREEPVQEYVDLARSLWDVTDLPGWAALQRRRLAGPTASRYRPGGLARSVRRRGREEWSKLCWHRTGA